MLEAAWTNQRWEDRTFDSPYGIVKTNPYLALKYFTNGEKSHAKFTEALALELIDYLIPPLIQEEDPCAGSKGAHTHRPSAKSKIKIVKGSRKLRLSKGVFC